MLSHDCRRWILVLVLLFSARCENTSLQAEDEISQEVTFERHIRPILRQYCFDCHGATEEKEGKLDLRLVHFIVRGGESGRALVPGDAHASLFIQRIADGEMPPGEGKVPADKLEWLKRWVDAGAKTERPEPMEIGPGVPITLEDRSYWAYRAILRRSTPPIDMGQRIRTPIDAMILQPMPKGLAFAPDADRMTLVQRAYFDLIGLPPSQEEWERWYSSKEEHWFEQMIDTLLDSPHYGERWSRHWLDVAGYADSEGQSIQDAERPWAWKYRDYVIRSLNTNKPFDRFLIEQLAGDELAGPKQGDWTDEQVELLTATGFLTMAADGTGSGENTVEARNKVLSDTIKIVSSSLLGSSVGCAQCHDHRYDPISQIDYYAMRAIFEPAMDVEQWRVPEARKISLYTQEDRQKAAEVEAEAAKVTQEKEAKQKALMAEALDKELSKYEEPLREELRKAYEIDSKQRSEEQTALLKKHPSVNITPGVLYQYLPKGAEELKKFDSQIAEIRSKKPKEEFVRAMTEIPDRIPITHLFHRGDHQQPKQKVLPSDLAIAAPEGELPKIEEKDPVLPTSGRRLAYARWLTSGRHPLVARVIVNRVWMHHFGQAIVPTPSEFGRLGMPPTHPELLDWLADEFMKSGWDLKQLHRLILSSTTWRQSSVRSEEQNALDPENKYYGKKSMQRLDAEVLRDRMLVASGSMDRSLFGPPVGIKADDGGQIIVDGPQKRRSLYVKVRRSQPVAMLQSFDAPVMDVNCERRPVSTVATQSLILMNGEFALAQSELLADRTLREAPSMDGNATYLAMLPPLRAPEWLFGYGKFDEANQRVEPFVELKHWTGSEWQGSDQRPDPTIGWVILNASGGHTGASFDAIRRWTSPKKGRVRISGSLQHLSEHGDGIRGRIVASRTGQQGEWIAFHQSVDTVVSELELEAGESVDFISNCRSDANADSFQWKVQIHFQGEAVERSVHDSEKGFHGPLPIESYDRLPSYVHYLWQLVYGRVPTEEEFRWTLEHLAEQTMVLQREPDRVVKGSSVTKQILANLGHVLFNSNEFVYVD